MAEFITSEKSGRRSSLQKLPPRIDLTAMVDLAFLLITFYMLTTSLAKPHMMEVAMPIKDTAPASDPASRTMTICLGKNNKVLWYMGMAEKPITPPTLVFFSKASLRSTLIHTQKRIFAASGKPLIVILKPSAHAVYADFVSVLDELSIANVQSYAIADISSKDIAFLTRQKAY